MFSPWAVTRDLSCLAPGSSRLPFCAGVHSTFIGVLSQKCFQYSFCFIKITSKLFKGCFSRSKLETAIISQACGTSCCAELPRVLQGISRQAAPSITETFTGSPTCNNLRNCSTQPARFTGSFGGIEVLVLLTEGRRLRWLKPQPRDPRVSVPAPAAIPWGCDVSSPRRQAGPHFIYKPTVHDMHLPDGEPNPQQAGRRQGQGWQAVPQQCRPQTPPRGAQLAASSPSQGTLLVTPAPSSQSQE